MRTRSNSGVRLDYYQRLLYKTILVHQDPVTGLLPASPQNKHAWIRDNVYCIHAVWGLSMAYKKSADLDEDRAKTYELEQSCVKLMRGLLVCMMQQKDKVERFKISQCPSDSLHAKFGVSSCQPVVKDEEWGHLQIDAVSLYLLALAQMTASGLQIVFNLDEVAFIQNLVFYIEQSYCIPDYGIWERGDKTNHGFPELNASSIGMAKAALEGLNDLDMFGARGGPSSVIHILADEVLKCQAVLQSMLPRESVSKEVDSALLSVIGYPAFAVDDRELITRTRETIQQKLQGRYGCRRFLRDGHKTAREDPNRLYYEPLELRAFENIECEWPLFFCYLAIDYCYQGNPEAVAEYVESVEELMVKTEDGLKLVPEMFAVPADRVAKEYADPGSQQRSAMGRLPFMWAQSLYVISKLLQEGFLAPAELDPLNRRLNSDKKPDVVVQVVMLAEDKFMQDRLRAHDIHVQTLNQVSSIEVHSAGVLSTLFSYLGRSEKLGLSGRHSRDVGILSTSKLYLLHKRIFAFTPQFMDRHRFYIASDNDLMIDMFKNELNFLQSSWRHMMGRPLVTMVLKRDILEDNKVPFAIISTIRKLRSGYTNGTRVTLGSIQDFLSTSCVTSLDFLNDHENGLPNTFKNDVKLFVDNFLSHKLPPPSIDLHQIEMATCTTKAPTTGGGMMKRRRMSLRGTIKRSRSTYVDKEAGIRLQNEEVSAPQPESHTDLVNMPRFPSDDKEDKDEEEVTRFRTTSDTQYEKVDLDELLVMLRESESLEEQGDILHYLVVDHGLSYPTGVTKEDGNPVTVRDLLKEMYEKACQQKNWALVRHIAGMLGKRVEDLAKAVTDLLVRQKQITVGMPPAKERTITAPLPANELRHLIHLAYGDDESTAMLTQFHERRHS